MNYNVTQNKMKILGKSKRKVQTISEKNKDKIKNQLKSSFLFHHSHIYSSFEN